MSRARPGAKAGSEPMMSIREAGATDFEKIYPLLLGFDNPFLTEEHWRQLFIDHSGCQNGHFGFILFDGEDPVGFIATIFSERTYGGENLRICNMSNWIVKNEYRAHSLRLLTKVLATGADVITNITPTAQVLKLCEKVGFTPIDKSERIIWPSPSGLRRRGVKVLTRREEVEAALSGEQLRICRDHALPWHRHAIILSTQGDCYLMMNRSKKAINGSLRLPFARIHHLSNAEVFADSADCLTLAMVINHKVVAMIVEERMLCGRRIWHSNARIGVRTAAFKSNKLNALQIDNLYSEVVLLNY
jgi:hypothetical protein